MHSAAVTVIIVSFNTKELTRRALQALLVSSVTPDKVIVVDNNSADGSADMVAATFPTVQLIRNTHNVGFAKANNQAIQLATTPYVWLLNSDTETGRRSLEQLVTYMEAHPRVAALGPQLVYPDGSLQSVGGYFPTVTNVFHYLFSTKTFLPTALRRSLRSIALYPQPLPGEGTVVEYVTGSALLLRRAALQECGMLAEEYFMYFEEADLCLRLGQRGWQCAVVDTEPVMHVYGGSFASARSPRRLTLFLESLCIFARKNYTGLTRALILLQVVLFGRLSIFLKSKMRSV